MEGWRAERTEDGLEFTLTKRLRLSMKVIRQFQIVQAGGGYDLADTCNHSKQPL